MSRSLIERSRPGAWHPLALPTVVVLGLLVAMVAVSWRELAHQQAVLSMNSPAAIPRAAPPPIADGVEVDRSALPGSVLFGIPADDAPAAEDTTADTDAATTTGATVSDELPTATLALAVQGIVFEPGRGGRAILGEAGTEPRSYRRGDTLPGGAIIRRVEARRVVVEQEGELRELALPVAGLGVTQVPVQRLPVAPDYADETIVEDEPLDDAYGDEGAFDDDIAIEDEADLEYDPDYAPTPGGYEAFDYQDEDEP